MPKYRVKSDINSGQHNPGEIIELSESAAAAMPWALEPLKPAAPVKTELKEEKKEEKAAEKK